jgi:ABC-type multidrug transport system fused ATPase/permease subunit
MTYERDQSDKTKMKILGHDYDDVDPLIIRERIEYLRSKPYLFSGTVRLNIDPEIEHTDEEICRVLHLLGGEKILNEIVDTKSKTVQGIVNQRKAQIGLLIAQ